MCKNPSSVWVQRGDHFEQVPVPCKDCWQCKANRVNDFIGRSMAEASTSYKSCCITLTYAPRDDLADKVITPRHFQLFMKRLRFAGHKVRYLVAGEYGDLRDRAHFHAILFFTDIAPLPEGRPVPFYNWEHGVSPETSGPFCEEIPDKTMCHIAEWPHGHVEVDWEVDEKSVRYVCEYVLLDKKTGWLSMSKKPPLGAEWFARKADVAIEAGVMPARWNYLPPGGDKKRPYYMTGATRRDYLRRITDAQPVKYFTADKWVQKSADKAARAEMKAERDLEGLDWDEFRKGYAAKMADAVARAERGLALAQYIDEIEIMSVDAYDDFRAMVAHMGLSDAETFAWFCRTDEAKQFDDLYARAVARSRAPRKG